MFKLANEAKFTHPVTVCVPVDGGHANETFKVTFRVLDLDQLDVGSLGGQQELLQKIVVGFDEIEDEDGNPAPYSEELRDRMIATPYVRAAIFQTYMAAIIKTHVGN